MPEIDNKDKTSSIDDNNTALDAISLEDIHNPEGIDPIKPFTTGEPNPTNVKPEEQVNTNPPVETKEEKEEEEDNNSDILSIKTFDDLLNIVKNKTTENLTEEESNEISDIISVFGGESFNKDGEIVDADGKILFTTEQVKHYLTNDNLPVDDNGDFVDAEGNVVKTKIELYRENTTVGTVMNALSNNFNINFKEDYLPEDTEDSIIDVVTKVSKVLSDGAVANYFKINPELEAFRKHLILHGSAEGYNSSTVDYDKIDVKTLSKETKQAYIKESYKVTGRTLTGSYTKFLESLNEEDLNVEVSDNLKVLKENQIKKQQEINSQIKAKEEKEKEETEKYWETITNTIKNGKLSNINIPVSEREGFLAYVTKPVANGKTKDMLDAEKEDISSDLLMSYLRYKGKDISALAKNVAQTQKVGTLRDKMNKNNARNNRSDKGKYTPKTQNDYIPGLNEINF